MVGFTAINSPNTTATWIQPDGQRPTTNSSLDNPESQSRISSVLSNYLGLGINHGHIAQGAAARKTRAASGVQKQRSKRSRYDTGTHNLRVEKISSSVSPAVASNVSPPTSFSDASNGAKNVSNIEREVLNDTRDWTPGSAHQIPVYAPITSMDVLGPTPVQSSMDSVKFHGNSGCTLYQAAGNSMDAVSRAEFTTTLLTQGSTLPVPGNTELPALDSCVNASHTFPTGFEGKAQDLPKMTNMDSSCVVERGLADSYSHKAGHSQFQHVEIKHNEQPAIEESPDGQAIIDLASNIEDHLPSRSHTPTPRNSRQNMREVEEHEDYNGALLSEAERRFLDDHAFSAAQNSKRIVRPLFPRAILDRSPVFGASPGPVLRTCFRLGEALNEGCQAARRNRNVIIELYARVISSWRDGQTGRKQHFILGDLYHDKAPRLEGTFELHNQSELWDMDSQTFLGPTQSSKMCRAVGRMKREVGKKWRLEILSIWETSWGDVDHVLGIVEDVA